MVGRTTELESLTDSMTAPVDQGVIIAGPAGVGKSRLASEVAQRLSRRFSVRKVAASASTRALPLGVFSDWVSAVDGNPLQLVRQVIAALCADTDSLPVLLLVDDAHLVDDLSAFVLSQLVVQRKAKVIATLRTDEPPPFAITALWKDNYLRRFDLEPLSDTDVAQLLAAVLHGEVEADCATALFASTGGNVLFLRCLVDQELGAGRLTAASGRWAWTGWVSASQSLLNLVELQMGALDDDVRDVIDLVAVGEPVECTLLSRLADAAALEDAETRGLVRVSRGPLPLARLGHPLYGEVRLARSSPAQQRRLRGRLALALANQPRAGDVDPVRVAALWLDSDLPPEPAVLGAGAAAAAQRLDAGLAERLIQACLTLGPLPEAALLRAHMLVLLIRSREAEEVMATVSTSTLSDTDSADLITVRTANMMWPLAEPGAAAALIEATDPHLGPATRAALRIAQAVQLAVKPAPRAALDVLAGMDSDDGALAGELPTAYRCWAQTIAAGDAGRVNEALASAERCFAISERSAKAAYQGVGVAEFAVSACVHAGLVTRATQVADRVWQRCVDVPGVARSVASAIVAIADLGAGRVDSACQRLSAAVDEFEQLGDTSGLIYRHRIVLAKALARAGAADAARAAERAMQHARHPTFGYVTADELLASAWAAASDGDLRGAEELSTRAAEFAAATGQLAWEVVSLQVAVGFGATGYAQRLQELAGLVEGPRAGVASRYASAVERGKPAAVLAASDEFAMFGDRLTAADAAALSAQMFRAAGRRADEYRATGRARRLLDGTGASSPLLRDAITVLPLSERERTIAVLVAQGLTNRGIAERLVTSIRTVEGHVYRIGNKIGSISRAELTAVLREWVDAPPGTATVNGVSQAGR